MSLSSRSTSEGNRSVNTLDSRLLQYADCFMQRFATSGVVRYEGTRGFGSTRSFDEEEGVFKIEVVEVPPGSKPSQHGVTIRLAEGRLQADPPTIEINAGDMVLWNSGL